MAVVGPAHEVRRATVGPANFQDLGIARRFADSMPDDHEPVSNAGIHDVITPFTPATIIAPGRRFGQSPTSPTGAAQGRSTLSAGAPRADNTDMGSCTAPEPVQSLFEAECPRCGVAMRPEAGWTWACPACGFRAERVAGTLVEIEEGPASRSERT